MKWIILILCIIAIPASAQERFPEIYWIIGDSHVLQGAGLSVGLCERILKNGDKCFLDSEVGARVTSYKDIGKGLSPEARLVVSLGMNSSSMPLKQARGQTETFVRSLGNRECYWVFPPVNGKNETAGYWKMMREAVKPCRVFDSRAEMEIPKHAIMGGFHLKIGYAKRVWAEKVWRFIND